MAKGLRWLDITEKLPRLDKTYLDGTYSKRVLVYISSDIKEKAISDPLYNPYAYARFRRPNNNTETGYWLIEGRSGGITIISHFAYLNPPPGL